MAVLGRIFKCRGVRASGEVVAGGGEDVLEHCWGELAGEGVLLTGVVGGEEEVGFIGRRVGEPMEGTVSETGLALRLVVLRLEEMYRGVEGVLAKGEDAFEVGEEAEGLLEEGAAGFDFLGERLVAGGRAMAHAGDGAVVVVTPVYEDAAASTRLFRELAETFGKELYIVAVDDGSVRVYNRRRLPGK